MGFSESDPPSFSSAWIEAEGAAIETEPARVRFFRVDDGRCMATEYSEGWKAIKMGIGDSFDEALRILATPGSEWLHGHAPENVIAAYTFPEPNLKAYFFEGKFFQSRRSLALALYRKTSGLAGP